MREKLMLSKSAYPADIQRVLTEMEKLYKEAVRDSRFEAAARLSSEQDEVIRTLNILALIGKNTVQNTEAEKLYFAYLMEQDEAKKAALKERYIATLRGYGTEEKERDSQLVLWIGESDSKTCEKCQGLKGTTYKPEDVPDLPHPNCRCEVRYVAWGAETRKEEAATTAATASIATTATTANTAKKSAATTAEKAAIKAIASATAATATATIAEKATGKAIASATTATTTAAATSSSSTPATTRKRLTPITPAVTAGEHLAPKTGNTRAFGKSEGAEVDAISSAALEASDGAGEKSDEYKQVEELIQKVQALHIDSYRCEEIIVASKSILISAENLGSFVFSNPQKGVFIGKEAVREIAKMAAGVGADMFSIYAAAKIFEAGIVVMNTKVGAPVGAALAALGIRNLILAVPKTVIDSLSLLAAVIQTANNGGFVAISASIVSANSENQWQNFFAWLTTMVTLIEPLPKE